MKGGLIVLALAVAAFALRFFFAGPEWEEWSRPEDLPASGPWVSDMSNFVTVRFEDTAGADIEMRRGTVPPQGKPVRELRWRNDAGSRVHVSDQNAGNGVLRCDGILLDGRAFFVDEEGNIAPDPTLPPNAIERAIAR